MEHSIESRRSAVVNAGNPALGGLHHELPSRSGGARALDPRPPDTQPDARSWNALLGAPTLTQAELVALGSIAKVSALSRGQRIFMASEPASTLVAVRDGDVALGQCDEHGSFQVERLVRGPGWLDQSSAWIDRPHVAEARAMTSLQVVELAREDVQALLTSFPVLARRLIGGLAREVHSLTANTQSLMHKDAPSRFAQWLVERCQSLPEEPGRAVVRLGERKRDIASQLAITPETLSRVMRTLTRTGVIAVAGYTVTVADLDALRRVATGL